jgi:hypothetical protein
MIVLVGATWGQVNASVAVRFYRRRNTDEGTSAMQQTLLWLKTWTVLWVVIALIVAFLTGLVLRALVRKSTIQASHALRLIESVSVVAGGAIGSVAVLLLLIILWPAAGNWLINTFLSDTLIWQTEFQQWITQMIEDPTTSSAIGLLIQRVQFGSAFLGFLGGWGAKWLLERLMGKGFHTKFKTVASAAQD